MSTKANDPEFDAGSGWKGLRSGIATRFIGYDQAERMVAALLDGVAAWRPEAIAGVVRGGLIPATMAACALGLPVHIIRYDRASGRSAWDGAPPPERRLLIVDDCCSTGETLARITADLRAGGYMCATLTIVHDPDVTGFVPDFSHPMRELFRLPWERGEMTPASRAAREAGGRSTPTLERPFIGLDLDGIFLPDIPRTDYARDLADALRRRHALEPFPSLPVFEPERAVVITARHETDRARTLEWLARWGFPTLALECRPEGVADTLPAVARYKAATATRLGCTHFVESEAEQAIRIAGLAPHLVVSWWSPEEARAWVLGAAAQPMP